MNLHQDCSYWRFSTSVNMLTCWIALSDMTEDMGPVEVARGSHTWGFAARPRELVHGSTDATDRIRRAISLHWAGTDCHLDRSKLLDYDHPYLLAGLHQGERLRHKYISQVYSGAEYGTSAA